ncbi:MAG: hypothetical protein HY481_01465 [Candidatus Vogelbacteria bacterium]|nr:hypothetical protein [Candidatus Vogelbacteria bacterium]
MNEPSVTSDASRNPLLEVRDFTWINGWDDWLKLWRATRQLEFLHSLLHFGFKLELADGENEARLAFYLALADRGGDRLDAWKVSREERKFHPWKTTLGYFHECGEIRKSLAGQAFKVLCLEFFRPAAEDLERYGYGNSNWWSYICQTEMLKRIFHFFRLTEDSGVFLNSPLLLPEHVRKCAEEFLLLCCNYALEKQAPQVNEHRTAFIRLLYGLGAIGRLLDWRVLDLDDVCLEEVYRLAMRYSKIRESSFGEPRPVKTIEEAVASGSKAAMVWMIWQTRKKELVRFQKIRELESARQRADESLAKLQPVPEIPV